MRILRLATGLLAGLALTHTLTQMLVACERCQSRVACNQCSQCDCADDRGLLDWLDSTLKRRQPVLEPLSMPRLGLLGGALGSRRASGCGCEVQGASCGCEMQEPSCGAEIQEPNCGAEIQEPNCGAEIQEPNCGAEIQEPNCGAEIQEPSCGVERQDPSCGAELHAPTCGCEMSGGCSSCNGPASSQIHEEASSPPLYNAAPARIPAVPHSHSHAGVPSPAPTVRQPTPPTQAPQNGASGGTSQQPMVPPPYIPNAAPASPLKRAPLETVPIPDSQVDPFRDDSAQRLRPVPARPVPARPVSARPSEQPYRRSYDPQANAHGVRVHLSDEGAKQAVSRPAAQTNVATNSSGRAALNEHLSSRQRNASINGSPTTDEPHSSRVITASGIDRRATAAQQANPHEANPLRTR